MDGHSAIGDDRTLRRIIAMLVALAALAEAVAALSLPVRFLVLCVLRHAEAVAQGFVAEATGTPGPAIGEIPTIRNGPADAVLLAVRLRALAAGLTALLGAARRFPCRNVRIGGALQRFAPCPGLITLGGWTIKPHDTS